MPIQDDEDEETNHADVWDICWHWESNLPCCYAATAGL